MARRYYTNPKFKTLLFGDKVLGRSLIKKARAYTGYLFDQLMDGQKFRTQRWTSETGQVIQVYVWRDVLGDRAIAKIYHPIKEELGVATVEIYFYMEHGWAMWSTISPETKRIYLGSDLTSYYSTGTDVSMREPITGDYIPEGCTPEDTEYLRGRATSILFDTDPVTGSIVWCEGAPSTDAEDSYLWNRVVGIEDERITSHLDTGEMRAVRQALHGAGKLLSTEILSKVGLTDAPRQIGIVIDRGASSSYSLTGLGNYWLYSISSSGCYMVQLAFSAGLLISISDLLVEYKDDQTSLDWKMLQSYLLGTLTVATGTPVYSVLTSEDLAPVYADSAAPLAHGWHGLYQPGPSDYAGIVSTFTRYDYGSETYYSRTAEISISWDSEGVPSADLDVSADAQWGGGGIRIRVPASNGQLQILRSGASVATGPVAIYSFTTPDGVAHLRKHAVSAGAGVQSQPAPSWPSFCGAGSDSSSGWFNRQWTQTTGFDVSGSVSVDGVYDGLVLEYKQYKSCWVNGGGGTIESRDKVTYPGDYLSVGTGICDSITKKYCYNSADGPWTVTLASDAGSEYTIDWKTGGSFVMVACILPTDTGVIIGHVQSWGQKYSSGNSTTHWDHSSNQLSISTQDITNGLIRSHSSLHTNAISVTDPSTGLGINVDEGYYPCDAGLGTNPWTSAIEYNTNEGELNLVSSAGEVIALNLNDWLALSQDSLQTNSPYVLVSAEGETISTPNLGEYESTIAGLDGDKFSGVFLPIGVA